MRAGNGADYIICVINIGGPVAQGFVHSIFQGPRTRLYRNNVRTQQLHAIDIRRLPDNVFSTHVNMTFQAQFSCNSGTGHAVLPCSCLRNDSRLAHVLSKECLANRIINLMRAGVI